MVDDQEPLVEGRFDPDTLATSLGFSEQDDFLDQLRQEQDLRDAQARARAAANQDVKIAHSSIGNFVRPVRNIWSEHYRLVADPRNAMGYSPSRFPYFDRLVSQNFTAREFDNPLDANFEQYEELKYNLATIRNYLMAEAYRDGSFDNDYTDRLNAQRQAQMATALGKGLENGTRLIPNPFIISVNPTKATEPGDGARYMYQKLRQKAFFHNAAWPVMWVISNLRGEQYNWWDVPPVEKSPFSKRALEESYRDIQKLYGEEEDISAPGGSIDAERSPMEQEAEKAANRMNIDAAPLQSVDSMADPNKRRSVEIAKDILNKLKVKLGDVSLAQGLTSLGDYAGEALSGMNELIDTFEHRLALARAYNGDIMNQGAIQQGMDAMGKLTYLTLLEGKHHAQRAGNTEQAQYIDQQIGQIPDSWKSLGSEPLGKTLDNLELGLNAIEAQLEIAERNNDTFGQSDRGRADNMSIGAHQEDRSTKNRMRKTASMEHFQEYQQQQAARKSARDAAINNVIAQQNMRNTKRTIDAQQQRQQQAKKAEKSNKATTLLTQDQIMTMRKALAQITPGTAAVTSNNAKETVRRTRQAKETKDQATLKQARDTQGRTAMDLSHATRQDAPGHKPQRDMRR